MQRIRAIYAGIALTLLQIALVCFAQGKLPGAAWENMYHWDSEHYGDIAAKGYFNTLPRPVGDTVYNPSQINRSTNVAFFPGYPLAARTLLTWGMPKHWALLWTAAIADVFFWTWFIAICATLTAHRWTRVCATLFVFSQPAAFYLVTAYSESLFLTGLTGMILFSMRKGKESAMTASAHGFAMSLTRVFGIPLAVLPVLHEFLRRTAEKVPMGTDPKKWLRQGLIGISAALGSLAFFAYCQYAFGWWNLYFVRQAAGWDLRPSWLLFNGNDFANVFWPRFFLQTEQMADALPTLTNRVTTTMLFWMFVACMPLVVRAWKKRIPNVALISTLFIAAGILYYLPLASLINADWRSMLRYAFPAVVFLTLAVTPLLVTQSRKANTVLSVLTVMASTALLTLQIELILRFSQALWVA